MHYAKFALNPNLWNPSAKANDEYIKDGLTKSQTEALQRLHRGMFGIVMVASLLLLSTGQDDEDEKNRTALNKLLMDMMLLVNIEKWERMIIMPAFSTFSNMTHLIRAILLQEEYKRDSKYGLKGELKAKRWAAALTPNLSNPFDSDQSLKTFIWGAPEKRGAVLRKAKRKRDRLKERFGKN